MILSRNTKLSSYKVPYKSGMNHNYSLSGRLMSSLQGRPQVAQNKSGSRLDGESAATKIERKANIYLLKKNGKFERHDRDLPAEKRFHSHIRAQADGLVQMSERALIGEPRFSRTLGRFDLPPHEAPVTGS